MSSRGWMSRTWCLVLISSQLIMAHLITTPAKLPFARATAYPGVGVGPEVFYGQLPGHQLFKRASVGCDQYGSFWCPTGTCFTDKTGLIGCCTASSCAPRTLCLPYTSGISSPCDSNTGGCTYCSDPATPSCMTITNTIQHQWIHYCDVRQSTEYLGYTNLITASSHLGVSASASSSSKPSTSLAASSSSSPSSSGSSGTSSTGTIVNGTLVGVQSTSIAAATASGPPSANQGNSTSNGTTIGAICGGAAAFALILAALWQMRKKWLPLLRFGPNLDSSGSSNEKTSSMSSSAPLTQQDSEPAEVEGSTPWPLDGHYSPEHISRHSRIGGRQMSLARGPEVETDGVEVTGLGIRTVDGRKLMPTNPDPMSSTEEADATGTAESVAVDAPTEHQLVNISPAISAPGSPFAAAGNSPASGAGQVSPPTPISPAYNYIPYTPSVYHTEPPSSIPRATGSAPPSLPQPYSTVSLGSTADLYRGLSGRVNAGRAPWAYLSAEDAVRGGWKNEEGSGAPMP